LVGTATGATDGLVIFRGTGKKSKVNKSKDLQWNYCKNRAVVAEWYIRGGGGRTTTDKNKEKENRGGESAKPSGTPLPELRQAER